MSKFVIYQVLPRLFGNYNTNLKRNGSIEENGCGKFNSFTSKALKSIKELGVTHIWYTGVIEHATKTDYSEYGIAKDHDAVVKGNAGSPYAIRDYYDVDPDLAEDVPNRMKEFEKLVTRTHRAGLKVIIDFIPNHVAREYHSDAKPENVKDLGETDNSDWHFSPLNNFYYISGQKFQPKFDIQDYNEFPAKATGNDCFSANPTINDWYETVKLNYGINYTEGKQKQFDPIPDTWFKMRDILKFWAKKKVDGFRCDMAEMVPVEFWSWAIPQIKAVHPEIIFIAEVYNPAEYRNYIANGKFDYLYDKVGLYDKLRDVTSRNFPVRDLTYTWQSLGGIGDKMLNFLENHDEQRIASGFFSGDGLFAQPAMIVAATLTKAPVMIYFGQELGEHGMDMEGFSGLDGRTTIFDYWALKSIQAWANNGKFDGKLLSVEQKELREFYQKLLNITMSEKAVTDGLMYDLEYANLDNHHFNSHEQYAYFRKFRNELLLIVLNFHDKDLYTEVKIPAEAFQYMNLSENQTFNCINLLDKEESYVTRLSSDKTFNVNLNAWRGKIFKLIRNK
ncbi:MAG: alpha-amylase family glycosyl hydrolase [Paludibacter sp.]|nr:alpha-amylase family glycosyl hydrolase [Paludibacter sp.]